MIYHLTILENTKARLIHDEISIRDVGAKDVLVAYFEALGFIVTVRIEE